MLDPRLHHLNSVSFHQIPHNDPSSMLSRALYRFNRARWMAFVEWLKCRILGREHRLLELESPAEQLHGNRRYGGIRPVNLDRICGTLGRSNDFDRRFLPLDDRLRDRWVSVAMARSRGIAIAPVELIQIGVCYFVKDGHHRISVARACGEQAIDAEVTIWEPYSGSIEPAIAVGILQPVASAVVA